MKTQEDKSKHPAATEEEPVRVPFSMRRLSCWGTHCLLTAFLLALALTVLALGLDWLLLGRGRWGPLHMTSLTNVILGLAVFLLLYFLLRHARQQQQQILERLNVIDEMNHHIRSALQVIVFNARPVAGNEWELAEIRQSIDRIQRTLREILPRVEPEYRPFESPSVIGGADQAGSDSEEQTPDSARIHTV